jgi:CRP-like cAMP-binding protein
MSAENSKLNKHTHLTKTDIHSYRQGDTLFTEGSLGKDVFIITEGEVGIYKKTENGEAELTRLKKGSMVGEMSLLDDQPRSATVRALVPTKAQVITRAVFTQTLEKTPVWLRSIIKILVSRLRDANNRVNQSTIEDPALAAVSLILLLFEPHRYTFNTTDALSHDFVCNEINAVCHLSFKRIRSILRSLSQIGLFSIQQDSDYTSHLCIRDPDLLDLFVRFRTLQQKNESFPEAVLPQHAVDTLQNIAYVAQKSGVAKGNDVTLAKSRLVADLADTDTSALQKDLLDLRKKNMIGLTPEDDDETIVFSRASLARIKKIREWVPRFSHYQR